MTTATTPVSSPLHLELPQLQTPLQPLDLARRAILAPSGLDEDRVARVLGNVMGHSVDYADLYFQLVREESWSLEDSIVKDGSHSIEQGVGVRALAGEKTGFAYSDEIVLPALDRSFAGGARDRAQRSDDVAAGVAAHRRVISSICRTIRSTA